jgi:hypothetical protein
VIGLPPLSHWIDTAELTSSALTSAALGVRASAGVGVPEGYQPSMRYSRTSSAYPTTPGLAIDVPPIDRMSQLSVVMSMSFEAELMLWPWKRTSGLILPSSVGPHEEMSARLSAYSP